MIIQTILFRAFIFLLFLFSTCSIFLDTKYYTHKNVRFHSKKRIEDTSELEFFMYIAPVTLVVVKVRTRILDDDDYDDDTLAFI